jgi:hypothetical protein
MFGTNIEEIFQNCVTRLNRKFFIELHEIDYDDLNYTQHIRYNFFAFEFMLYVFELVSFFFYNFMLNFLKGFVFINYDKLKF